MKIYAGTVEPDWYYSYEGKNKYKERKENNSEEVSQCSVIKCHSYPGTQFL